MEGPWKSKGLSDQQELRLAVVWNQVYDVICNNDKERALAFWKQPHPELFDGSIEDLVTKSKDSAEMVARALRKKIDREGLSYD